LTVTQIEEPGERSRICRKILDAAEEYLREPSVEFFEVKTLGPSRLSQGYERTRGFHEARGFVPLEELEGVRDENNPCLLLVKHLPCR
jgi:hypothetical protein